MISKIIGVLIGTIIAVILFKFIGFGIMYGLLKLIIYVDKGVW